MQSLYLILPMALFIFSSCGVQKAMERNAYAIQRSTCAIEQNIQALNKVTERLKKMQEEESGGGDSDE